MGKSILLDLKELGQDVCDAALKELEDGAGIIVADAKSRVHDVSGALSNSIHLKKLSKGQRIRIIADAKDEKGFAYGAIVEFSPRINKPFLYPALEAHRAEIKQKIIDAIRGAVHKNAKR